MSKQFINPPGLYHSKYYTQAVAARGGTTLYASGQWAYDAAGELVGRGDKRAQALLAFQNLKAVLAAGGATPADVVKINVYFVDYSPADLAILEDGLTECFGLNRHFASTLLGVQALALDGMLVEVEAVAVVD